MTDGPEDWSVWLGDHGAALVLLARQWVAGHPDAEDVVQEAFTRFWPVRERVGDPVAYLYACVKNQALNWNRSRRRRTRREGAAAPAAAQEPLFAGVMQQERQAASRRLFAGSLTIRGRCW